MSAQVTGVEELMFLLRTGGAKAVRGAVKQMDKEATAIQQLAIKMAPIDEGNLEDAIKVERPGGVAERNALGQFKKKTFTIYIDGTMQAGVNREGKATTVGDYAWWIHEHLSPFGHLNLGKRSLAKQSGSDVIVGGKFLERAVAEIERGLINRVIERALDEFDD